MNPAGEPSLLPVGTPCGMLSGFDGLADGGGLVRLGAEMIALEPSEYRLWDAIALRPSVAEIRTWAEGNELANAETLLRSLQRAGLVVEWLDGDPADELAQRYGVGFIGRFVGNGPSGRDIFLLSDSSGRIAAGVDLLVYEFLLWAQQGSSIREACDRIDARNSGVDLMHHVLAAVPILMRSGLVRLDVCVNGDQVEGSAR
jgi:hypothetical protein